MYCTCKSARHDKERKKQTKKSKQVNEKRKCIPLPVNALGIRQKKTTTKNKQTNKQTKFKNKIQSMDMTQP